MVATRSSLLYVFKVLNIPWKQKGAFPVEGAFHVVIF